MNKSLYAAVIILIVIIGGYFWLKGTPAPVTGSATTTSQIITGTDIATYTDSELGFSIQYPSSAAPSQSDITGFLPRTQTPVTSFILPATLSAGTNLGEAGVYIGATSTPAIVSTCLVATSDNGETGAGSATINGTEFIVSTANDAGAGNFYESKIYRTVKNGMCIELVETLHSGNINNYPEGTVTEFDHAKFSGILDAIVHTYKNL